MYLSGLGQVRCWVFWLACTSFDMMEPLATWSRPALYDNLSNLYTQCIHFKENNLSKLYTQCIHFKENKWKNEKSLFVCTCPAWAR